MLCRWEISSPIYRGSGQCCCLSHRCMPSVQIFEGAQRILKHSSLKMLQLHKPRHHFIFPYFWIMGTRKTVDLGWFWPLFYIPRRDHRRLDWTLAKFSSVGIVGFVRLFGNFQRSKGIMDRFPEGDLPSNWPGARQGSQVSSRLAYELWIHWSSYDWFIKK